MGGCLLIVGHGPGRGRPAGNLPRVIRDLAAAAPALRGAVRFHATGGGPPPDLAEVRAVVFWLADPLRELYPACFAEAVAIAERARAAGARLVNPPEALSNSIKSVQAALWTAAGLPTPPHRRFASRAELAALAAEPQGPLLVKADLLHSQAKMRLCRSAAELRALADGDLALPGAVAPFVDTRAGYRTACPGSLWARYYHKKRAIVLGDIVHPRHVLFSADPIVGLKRATLYRYARLPGGRWLLPFAPDARASIAADNAFWSGPPEEPALLRAACRALGLDMAGIDYATFADGRVVLWEANPYFYLYPAGRYPLARERRFAERYATIAEALRRFLEGLLTPPAGAATSHPR